MQSINQIADVAAKTVDEAMAIEKAHPVDVALVRGIVKEEVAKIPAKDKPWLYAVVGTGGGLLALFLTVTGHPAEGGAVGAILGGFGFTIHKFEA